ncbi:GNAT family N-acetyltransferase [Nocardia pneumoniae]|uniref:GNAT family N-acetyltransferase n=1 Tax=Nocardia pneumoniae TaxID=228601 RepID=UPI00030D0430|nr:GNAT family N-acetyltransferase [Nocardia pneumoniae]
MTRNAATHAEPVLVTGSGGPADPQPWRNAVCRLYGTSSPVVPLGKIMHWRAVTEALGVETPAADPALIAGGYFYRPHTTAPDAAELEADIWAAVSGGARWLLYPVVRGAAALLERHGFVELPWFVEAEFVTDDEPDHQLRTLMGGARFRELRRMVRRAEEQFEWHMTTGDRIDDEILTAFDRLHRLNLAKYGHTRNHFALPILRDLTRSALGERMCFFLHRQRSGGTPVQAVLAMRYPESNTVEVLVQGIDHAVVPPAQNLYATALYRIYRWGWSRGIHRFNLGRGAQLAKLNLGANRFHVVSNHIAPVTGDRHEEFAALRAAARASMNTALAALRAAADRRSARDVVLPRDIV